MADIDDTNPADNAIVSQFPANERAHRANIEAIIEANHFDETGRHRRVSLVVQSPAPAAENNAFLLYAKDVSTKAELFFKDEDDHEIQMTEGGVLKSAFASGTRMLFQQGTAPTGWTQDTTWNDRVVRIVSGASVSTGGSWTLTGLTMPHTHAVSITTGAPSTTQGVQGASNDLSAAGTHTHSVSGDTGAASISTVVSAGAWRPLYVDFILCEKD